MDNHLDVHGRGLCQRPAVRHRDASQHQVEDSHVKPTSLGTNGDKSALTVGLRHRF